MFKGILGRPTGREGESGGEREEEGEIVQWWIIGKQGG